MKKPALLSAKELAELFHTSEKTISRDRADGLPVAKMLTPPGGGKPAPLFDAETCKAWYLKTRPTSKVAHAIVQHCPPPELAAARRAETATEKTDAARVAAVADIPPPPSSATADEVLAFLERLRAAEASAYDRLQNAADTPNCPPNLIAVWADTYSKLANRRQSFEEALPRIMAEKKRFVPVADVARIVTRAFAAASSHIDRLGFALGERVTAPGINANDAKNLIDQEGSKIKAGIVKELGQWLPQ